MASTIYIPLQRDGSEFRLLVLQPSTDCLAPVQCVLNGKSFDDGRLKYAALSYTWGDPLATRSILVNGVETQVTLNLEAALRHIRQPSNVVILWVDALCINQEDLAEKSQQVEMMRDIYSKAEIVLVWLGSAGEDSDLAMGVFGKGLKAFMKLEGMLHESDETDGTGSADSWMTSNQQGVNVSSECREEDITTPSAQIVAVGVPKLPNPAALANSEDAGAILDLIDQHQDEHDIRNHPSGSSISRTFSRSDSASSQDGRSYDRLVESKDSSALMKEYRMALERLPTREILAMWKLLTRSWWCRIWVVQEVLLAKKVIFKCGDAEVSGQQMSSWGSDVLLVLYTLCAAYDSAGHIVSAVTLLGSLQNPAKEKTVVQCLNWYDMQQATKPHDHIYGLLGIIPASHRSLLGAPDYSCKAEDLFIKVATKVMAEDNSLELLCAAGMSAPPGATSSKRMILPSWVPDWTRRCLNTCRGFGIGKDLSREPIFSFSENLTELTVTGYKFDVIESTKSIPALSQGELPLWRSILIKDEYTRDDQGPPPLQVLIDLLLLGDWSGEESDFCSFAAFLQELEEYRASASRCEARGDHENPDYLAGFLHWTGETRDGRTDEEILQKVYCAETARSFSMWRRRQSSADLRYEYMSYSTRRNGLFGTAGFSMFRTTRGSFGITRAAVVTGDIICDVPGCLDPLVLREVDVSKYLLLGPTCKLSRLTHEGFAQTVEKGGMTAETFTLL